MDMDVQYCECYFIESVAQFVADGSCSCLLCPALSGLVNLKAFTIQPPRVDRDLIKTKSAEIQRRWFMSCKTLLVAALTGAIALEELSIERIPGNSRMPLSALEVIASNWPQWATSLVKLQLNFVNDIHEGMVRHQDRSKLTLSNHQDTFHMSVRMITAHLVRFTALAHLQLSLLNTPALYFKQLAKALPMMGLQTLDVQNISTRYRYIVKFLSSCTDTLRSFSLSHSRLAERDNFEQSIRLCTYILKLRKCVFRSLNAGNQGLHLGRFNQSRPQTVEDLYYSRGRPLSDTHLESDQRDWVSVYINAQDGYAVELDSDEGDDIKHWLSQLQRTVELKEAWDEERFSLARQMRLV